jgi:Grx4 family monothiol glutaredoxin
MGRKAVLLFWAPWHEASTKEGPMDALLQALAAASTTDNERLLFGRVQAEECPLITEKYNVTVVPTFVLLNSSGDVVERIEGGDDAAEVTLAVQRLINLAEDRKAPSNNTMVLGPPTMSSDIAGVASADAAKQQLSERLDRLIRYSEIMVFMKGIPTAPRCGFSRQVVELLQEENIPFGSFDILTDETVRQGLKMHSDWPTYPQIYCKGELIGGLDILKEMKEEDTLRNQLGIVDMTTASTPLVLSMEERLDQLVNRHPVMLFMKGLPSAPQCGFSRQVVAMLDAENISYDSFDILQDEEVRQGLKTYSDWPTFPQLYVNGDLIGGLDIVKEMKEDGTLRDTLVGR